MNKYNYKTPLYGALLIAAVVIAYFVMANLNMKDLYAGFASGNGRIESTQVNIAAKFPGRLAEVAVHEGDMVKKGQLLAKLDTNELQARLKQAEAQVAQAVQQKRYATAIVTQRQSELSLAAKNLERSKTLYVNKNISLVQLQQHETAMQSAQAALLAAKSQVISAGAAIDAAKAQIETIKVNIDDSNLYAPVDARVLYRLAEPGEMIGSGGNVLVLLDLLDTYMTIFLPTSQAGLVDIGSEARIILDALPDIAIPAHVTYVSPQAQFTPKEIETQSEREKLMFRVKVKIDSNVLKENLHKVKTGLPGVAYVPIDASEVWPEDLNKLPENRLKEIK
jgi:HlyD family secretion protein